ncbi:MAG: AEC family transporter [Gloeotrichia echinulata GP01]
MIENLFNAYTPLFTWIGLGLILSRFSPDSFLKLLGQGLYWIGVPVQMFVLARHTNLSNGGLILGIVVGVLLLSLALALLLWWGLQWFINPKVQPQPQSLEFPVVTDVNSVKQASLGSFILAAIVGNTSFIGLTLTQVLISPENTGWAVLYSVINNIVGTYGIAVLISSYFGKGETKKHWWINLRDFISVPSRWTFLLGLNTQFVKLPQVVESGLNQAVWVVIAFALLLVGLRLGSLRGWKSLKIASIASIIKVLIIPMVVGLCATYFGVTGEQRLVLVLMSGTPTGLAVLILAEVYDLDRNLLASSIALTFVGLLLALPLWLAWFG